MESQYLNSNIISSEIPFFDFPVNHLGSTDTYHEFKIMEKIKKYSKKELMLLIKASVQVSVIGAGKKNFGFIRDDSGTQITLSKIFDNLNIQYKNTVNSLLKDDDLTVRRLVRFFRYHIQDFIMKNNRPSYLWLKYANKENPDMFKICFPGAEHLVQTRDECFFLMETYKKLDEIQNTNFNMRLQRVFIARGVINPNEFV